jgi:acetoacetate decarboxylase
VRAPAQSAQPVTYPPPPWRLSGTVVLGLARVPRRAAQRQLPAGVRPLPVGPGGTLAGLLLASYDARSTLSYNELIAFTAVARRRGRVGMWVSHVYVDDGASLSGGRAIWRMPKQMAEFRLEDEAGTAAAEIRQGGQLLARVHVRPPRIRWPQPVIAPVLSGTAQERLFTLGRGLGTIGPVRVEIDVPPESPLAGLALADRAIGVAGTVRRFVMPPPDPGRSPNATR